MADTSGISSGMTVTFGLETNLIKDIYTSVTVKGIVGFDIASAFEDVAAIHANIYSTLPEGTPASAEDYEYLLVKTIDGQNKAVGVPWIAGTITIVDSATISVTISNSSSAAVDTIRKALNAYGITDFAIEVTSSSSTDSTG